ncbi:INTS9 [Cordylochernes scorpioides]|uniref:INTS9 n=1 Tax=Cordylochernes scorpioides TaxID=51811 RepID=A0ABY6KI19_9ARAC|nr:INTS9 [Cordylochernes scorpioides]
MKLYCLSGHTTKCCNVLTFKNTTIMFDCGLDITSILNFVPLPLVHSAKFTKPPSWVSRDIKDPQLDDELCDYNGKLFVDSSPEFCPPESNLVDYSRVDIILISNYQTMLALPYITENTGFSGTVYATEPTLQIGRQFMEEMATYLENTPKLKQAKKWKQTDILKTLAPPLCEALKPQTWKTLYSRKTFNNSLSKVKIIGHGEDIDVFGELKVTAISSGYCLGSCNWQIKSDFEKIVYISASSTLTTHPQSMEHSLLKGADVLILTSLTQTPTANPDTMLGELCNKAAITVRNGGNVLIPCYPSGVVYDLLECLASQLDTYNQSAVPIYFLSPVADHSLAYSNILAEWLSHSKQNKVYIPEEPFPHAHLVKTARVKHFPGLCSEAFNNEYKTPCIVFTGHCSLRFGDAVHLMELWGSSPNNVVIFTEPDFPYLDAIAPFYPLAMKVFYYPIDTSLNFSQANKLISDHAPKLLVTPEAYTSRQSEQVLEAKCPILTFKRCEILEIPLQRKYGLVEVYPELAADLVPVEVRPGVCLATVTGECSVQDNRLSLSSTNKRNKFAPNYAWGSLDVSQLLYNLHRAGHTDAKIEQGQSGLIIHLRNADVLIQVEDHSTHIVCEGNTQVRTKIRDFLLQSLNKF